MNDLSDFNDLKNNYLILATPNHPLYQKLQQLAVPFETYTNSFSLEATIGPDTIVWDFTILSTSAKVELLEQFSKAKTIYAEASCCWGEMLLKKFPHLRGVFATAFLTQGKKFEYFLQDKTDIR